EVYAPLASAVTGVSIAPATMDLAQLLAMADGIVTMNSTVAIDGLVLGIPALVIGLPNNLSPFVEAGVMFGAVDAAASDVRTLLYDRAARENLLDRARQFATRYEMRADGRAADRAADRILAMIG
ncbi:MAG: hypothetical protein ABI652_03900, partial [Acidobacteriota bacterium]